MYLAEGPLIIYGTDLKRVGRVLGKTKPKAPEHLVPKMIVAVTPQAFKVNFVAEDLTEIQCSSGHPRLTQICHNVTIYHLFPLGT